MERICWSATFRRCNARLAALPQCSIGVCDMLNGNDDDAAVRSLKGTLQSLDEGSPEVFFVCLGVGCAAGLVVCIDEGVVPE